MFCGECGVKNDEGVKFCGSCGSELVGATQIQEPPNQPSGGMDFEKIKDSVKAIKVDDVKNMFVVPNEDSAKISIAGIEVKADLVFKVLSGLLFVTLLLPFFSVSVGMRGVGRGYRESFTVNGFRAISLGSYGSIFAIFLIIIPIAMFVLFQFKGEIAKQVAAVKGKLFTIAAGVSAFGFLMTIITMLRISASAYSTIGLFTLVYETRARGSVGFVISLLLYAIATAVAVGFVLAERKKKA